MLDKVLKIVKSMNQHKVNYVIIGGYAIIMHGYLRATEDLDIMIEMDEENVIKLQQAMKDVYEDKDIEEISYSELEKFPVMRYGTPDNFYIDVISGLGTEFSFKDIKIVEKNIEGVTIPFASIYSLYEMKNNTYREKDKLDLLFIKQKLKDD